MKGAKPKQDAARRGVKPTPVEIIEVSPIEDSSTELFMTEAVLQDTRLSMYWALLCPPINNFTAQDAPLIEQLCKQYVLLDETWNDLTIRDDDGNPTGEYRTLTQSSRGDWREHPSLKSRKQLISEIRAISDMLGMSPLSRSRIGLMDAVKTKSAAETAEVFYKIEAAYGNKLLEGN